MCTHLTQMQPERVCCQIGIASCFRSNHYDRSHSSKSTYGYGTAKNTTTSSSLEWTWISLYSWSPNWTPCGYHESRRTPSFCLSLYPNLTLAGWIKMLPSPCSSQALKWPDSKVCIQPTPSSSMLLHKFSY